MVSESMSSCWMSAVKSILDCPYVLVALDEAEVSTPLRGFVPFNDDTSAISAYGLTVENGTDKVALYADGLDVEVTHDKRGVATATKLLTALSDRVCSKPRADIEVVDLLQIKVLALTLTELNRSPSLPEVIAPTTPPETVNNPFA